MVEINPDHFLWVEKYRPLTVEECILPEANHKIFTDFTNQGEIPNLLLTGAPGTGKTTVARALCHQLGLECIVINGSEHGNIDTLRTKIKAFASTVSLNDKIKVVILDEADYLNPQSTMPALRGFIEEYANNCRFILTCNYENRIIEPLHSRLVKVNFAIPTAERPQLAAAMFKRVKAILHHENVQYDKNAVATLIKIHFPDFRKIVNELQRYSAAGSIDAGVLVDTEKQTFDALFKMIKSKDFNDVRRWVGENPDVDVAIIGRELYNRASDVVESASIPEMILIINEYIYKNAFVADVEINTVAMLVELMSSINLK